MSWMTQIWTPDGRRWNGGSQNWAEWALLVFANNELVDPAQLCGDDRCYEITDLFGNADVSAFVYLYLNRRFGPSPRGYDADKDFGCWRLTTPDPDLVVSVYPKADSIGVGVLVPNGLSDFWRPPLPVATTVVATLRDLMRPVSLRDSWLNLGGPCELPDETEEASVFEWAGYGVEPDYWERFRKPEGGGR